MSKKTQWRLIPPLTLGGETQMAIDSWLLEQHLQGNHPPTLRFYQWFPVAISLGYLQHTYPPHWSELTWEGHPLSIVRRPTGGRAVLHHGDLTYALVTSAHKTSRTEIYQYLCQFLIEGWHHLGLDLHYGLGGRGYIHQTNCFRTSTPADLVDDLGQKFIGSSQKYIGSAVLQHGSMQLAPNPQLFTQVFGDTAPPSRFPHAFTDGHFLTQVIQTLTDAACSCFNIDLITKPLSNQELAEIQKMSVMID